ncbi:unnamed protein product [Candidula unifasciata]|uniref:TRAF-type domain-containing protein n=1 Tax=Candidula unifasciata TaxID=100452 RepID=A0A8S3YSB7_9EUPU|nr:unnamed protein product [Candidula unifasciata]
MFPDLATEREILSLRVQCVNVMEECAWTGDLRELENHRKVCQMEQLLCNNGCTMSIKRKDVNHHEESCSHRLVKCPYCPAKVVLYLLKTERHLMAEHLHQTEIVQQHLNLALQRIVKMDRTVQNLSNTVTNLEENNLSVIPMLLQNDKKHTQAASELRERNITGRLHWKLKLSQHRRSSSYSSPAFYTGCPGYKVQLILDMEGPREGSVKYTKLSLALLPGDYDYQVVFPFNGTCMVKLFDQFMKCADLVGSHSRYSKNGYLHFEATVVHSYYPQDGSFNQGCVCSALMPHGLDMAVTPKRPIASYSDSTTHAQSAQIMQLSAISIGN